MKPPNKPESLSSKLAKLPAIQAIAKLPEDRQKIILGLLAKKLALNFYNTMKSRQNCVLPFSGADNTSMQWQTTKMPKNKDISE